MNLTEFRFQEGNYVKIIQTSFLYATALYPEAIHEGRITEIEDTGFWAEINITRTFTPDEARVETVSEEHGTNYFFGFQEIEGVVAAADPYPDRRDPLVRFALDGP